WYAMALEHEMEEPVAAEAVAEGNDVRVVQHRTGLQFSLRQHIVYMTISICRWFVEKENL
ncbi:hypothetical protein DYB25_007660, partial [Aphanomyces astaci]